MKSAKELLNQHNIIDITLIGRDILIYTDNGNYVYNYNSVKDAREIFFEIQIKIDPISTYLQGLK